MSRPRHVLAIAFTTVVLLVAFVEPVAAWVPSSIYEPERAAPGAAVRVFVTPPCGGSTLYLWPGRAEWGVSYPTGPRDRHLVRVPLRATDDPAWLVFTVPRLPAGWYTPFFDSPPGCPFMAAGSTDTQRFFEVLSGAPDTATARGEPGPTSTAPWLPVVAFGGGLAGALLVVSRRRTADRGK